MSNINVPANNFTLGRTAGSPNIPDMIVMHTSGNTTESAINTITNPSSGVSYHFLIAAGGTTHSAVGIRDTAHANGTGTNNLHHSLSTSPIVRSRAVNANNYTISISFGDMNLNNGHLTQAQINAAANLMNAIRAEIFMIWGTWNNFWRSNVIGHSEVTPRMADGSVRHCPLWNTAVPFPFNNIINLFHSLPILFPSSVGDPIVANLDTDGESDLKYASYYESELYEVVHGSLDNKPTKQ